MSLLKLEKIEPQGRLQGEHLGFTAREWKEVFQARARGLAWKQIWAATKRHPSANALNVAALKRLQDYTEGGSRRKQPKARAARKPRASAASGGPIAEPKRTVVKYKTVKRRHGRGRRKVKVRAIDAKRIVRERVNAQLPLAASPA